MPKPCSLPPSGWRCTSSRGHSGPCAAVPQPRSIEQLLDEGVSEMDQVLADVRSGIRSAGHFDELEERTQAACRKMRDAWRKGAR